MYSINLDTAGINRVYKSHLCLSSAGETVPDQVHCCMRVLQEFQGCSVEVDGVQLLRTKFLGLDPWVQNLLVGEVGKI